MFPASESPSVVRARPAPRSDQPLMCLPGGASLDIRTLQPEYQLLARQWQSTKKHDGEDHFFAYIDFATGPTIFQRVSLPSLDALDLSL